MHGLIFAELQKYVTASLGAAQWSKVLAAAKLNHRTFVPVNAYADDEAMRLFAAAAASSGKPTDVFLSDFGEFIAPDLLRMYAGLVAPEWRTLDVIEHTEETIHKVVRAQNPGAAPPRLRCHRLRPNEVAITYASPRKLCAIAKGIVRGIAVERGDDVAIAETSCMLRGAPSCEIRVTLKA
jgi:heme-NO-binding protein